MLPTHQEGQEAILLRQEAQEVSGQIQYFLYIVTPSKLHSQSTQTSSPYIYTTKSPRSQEDILLRQEAQEASGQGCNTSITSLLIPTQLHSQSTLPLPYI